MNEFKEIRERVSIFDVAARYGLNVHKDGKCNCPFHSENTASMQLYKTDNKFYCFGCGAKGDAIDLTMRLCETGSLREAAERLNYDFDLGIRFGSSYNYNGNYGNRNYSGKPYSAVKPKQNMTASNTDKPKWVQWDILRTHEYQSKDKQKLALKIIYRKPDGSKAASWRRYEGNTLMKGLNGLKMPLYHVWNVTDKNKPVFIVEGEKDVESLERLGFVATTSPNGAGSKWLKEYDKEFKDFDVIILADNDEVGEKHAREVAESVLSEAKSVKLVLSKELYPDLQSKGDISDIISLVGAKDTIKLLADVIKSDKYTYYTRNPTEIAKENRWLNSAAIVVNNYLRVLNKWEKEYKNFPQGTKQADLYNEALGFKDTVEYFSDKLSNGLYAERHEIYKSYKSDIEKFALRLENIREQRLDTKLISMSEVIGIITLADNTKPKEVKPPKRKTKRSL